MEILKFYTDTCMPCKVVGKMLDKLEGVKVTPVNALEDIEKVDIYNICTTPTLIFLKDGVEVERTHGMVTESQVKEIIEKNK